MYIDENCVLFPPLFCLFYISFFVQPFEPSIEVKQGRVKGEGCFFFLFLFLSFFVQLTAVISLPGHLCAGEYNESRHILGGI